MPHSSPPECWRWSGSVAADGCGPPCRAIGCPSRGRKPSRPSGDCGPSTPASAAVRVDVACRAAAWSLIGTGSQIGWVEVTPDGDVGLRLSGPARLPSPWTGADHDWWLAADVPVELLSDDARQVGMPCVALVQLGVTAACADILIDVEACGTLAVEARRDQADEVITALAAGLASSMYAEVAHLIGVRLPSPALLGHRNAHVADSTDTAVRVGPDTGRNDRRQRADVVRTALAADRRRDVGARRDLGRRRRDTHSKNSRSVATGSDSWRQPLPASSRTRRHGSSGPPTHGVSSDSGR